MSYGTVCFEFQQSIESETVKGSSALKEQISAMQDKMKEVQCFALTLFLLHVLTDETWGSLTSNHIWNVKFALGFFGYIQSKFESINHVSNVDV